VCIMLCVCLYALYLKWAFHHFNRDLKSVKIEQLLRRLPSEIDS